MNKSFRFSSTQQPPQGDSVVDFALSQPYPLMAIFNIPPESQGQTDGTTEKFSKRVDSLLDIEGVTPERTKFPKGVQDSFFYKLEEGMVLDCSMGETGVNASYPLTVVRVSSSRHNYIKLRSSITGKEYALRSNNSISQDGQLNMLEKRENVYDKKVTLYLNTLPYK